MCGIVGKASFGERKIQSKDISQMSEALAHRGPDDQGVFLSEDGKLGLGHQRLAIIDLSSCGHQPMTFQERYTIVFNGEIYNFPELRSELISKGYKFGSQTDTEVILALYAEHGKECVKFLRGMFAFALYDKQEQTIFCARDRVGKKPFKYLFNGEVFIFASELKAILTQPEYTRALDHEAIHHYLTLQYVPAPLTGFKDIWKLEPASTLLVDLKTKTVTKARYWELDYSKKLNLSPEDWKKRILEKLEESVRIRMLADVPLGAFLSGGIDSSAVVALMSRHSEKPVKTFSIGFKESSHNELPYARMIAKKFGTEHTEFIVDPKAIELLPLLAKSYEEPFADSSALPTYLVSKLTREHVTVALNGDGGDENFAGYGRYSVLQFSIWYEKLLPLHTILVAPIIRFLHRTFPSPFIMQLHRFSEGMFLPYNERYVDYLAYFTHSLKEELYTDAFKEKTTGINSVHQISEAFFKTHTPHKIEQALGADFLTYLPGDLEMKVDIASMAVSLEGRSPFLDHELLELTAQIPFSLKLKGLNDKKHILKETLRGLVPGEVLFRKKMGFGIPIQDWFRGALKSYAEKILLSSKAESRNIYKKESVRKLLEGHTSGKANYGYQIWALIMLELWMREYFDKK